MKFLQLGSANPMRVVLVMTLVFEAIVHGLAIPVMMLVTQTPAWLAVVAGGGAAILALVASMMMRRPHVGYPLGWATQVAALALGFLTTAMFALGGLFLVLWSISFVLGRRLEQQGKA